MGEDMEIPRKIFLLSEAAKELSLTENEVLHLAAAGRIAISIRVTGRFIHIVNGERAGEKTATFPNDEYDGLLAIPADDAERFLTKQRVRISYFIDDNGNEYMTPSYGQFLTPFGEKTIEPPGYYGIEELCVSLAEIARVKKEKGHNEVGRRGAKKRNGKSQNEKKTGRRKSALSEAVDFLYDKALADGNTEILKPDKIEDFMQELQRTTNKNQTGFENYLADLITVKKVSENG